MSLLGRATDCFSYLANFTVYITKPIRLMKMVLVLDTTQTFPVLHPNCGMVNQIQLRLGLSEMTKRKSNTLNYLGDYISWIMMKWRFLMPVFFFFITVGFLRGGRIMPSNIVSFNIFDFVYIWVCTYFYLHLHYKLCEYHIPLLYIIIDAIYYENYTWYSFGYIQKNYFFTITKQHWVYSSFLYHIDCLRFISN